MQLTRVFTKVEDTDIEWNYYFTGILAYGFLYHDTIDDIIAQHFGSQHRTKTDFIKGTIFMKTKNVAVYYDENDLTEGQKHKLLSSLKSLFEEESIHDVKKVSFLGIKKR